MSKSTPTLPEYVEICPRCNGAGEYSQTYTQGCGMGYFSMIGPCGICEGARFIYTATYKPVPASVVAQIAALRLAAPAEGDATHV